MMMIQMITDIVFPSFDNKQRQQQKSFPIDILNKQILLKFSFFLLFAPFSNFFSFLVFFGSHSFFPTKKNNFCFRLCFNVCLFVWPAFSVLLFFFFFCVDLEKYFACLLFFIKIQVFFPLFFRIKSRRGNDWGRRNHSWINF